MLLATLYISINVIRKFSLLLTIMFEFNHSSHATGDSTLKLYIKKEEKKKKIQVSSYGHIIIWLLLIFFLVFPPQLQIKKISFIYF